MAVKRILRRKLAANLRVFHCKTNDAAKVLARNHLSAVDAERMAYMAGLPTESYEAQLYVEGLSDLSALVQEARGGIEEDWLCDELGDLKSIAEQMRPKKCNPLRDELLAIIQKIEDKRDEEVQAVEHRTEQLDKLEEELP